MRKKVTVNEFSSRLNGSPRPVHEARNKEVPQCCPRTASPVRTAEALLVTVPPSFPCPYAPFPGTFLPESPARIILSPCPNAQFPFLRSVLPEPKPPLFIGTGKTETENSAPEYRISDIFRTEGEKLLQSGKLSPEQAKAVFSIMNCRTQTYGYHADVCDEYGFIEIAYNACRNRHCPQYQGTAKKRWVNARLDELLPVPYHHVVFTVPSYISKLSLYNQKIIYDLLFQSAAQTLLTFGRDPKFLGAEFGFYGILHTWSQPLGPHIHIHFIVTTGGLTEAGEWKEAKHGKKFLFPVRAVSKVFRGKFIEGMKKLYYNLSSTSLNRHQRFFKIYSSHFRLPGVKSVCGQGAE